MNIYLSGEQLFAQDSFPQLSTDNSFTGINKFELISSQYDPMHVTNGIETGMGLVYMNVGNQFREVYLSDILEIQKEEIYKYVRSRYSDLTSAGTVDYESRTDVNGFSEFRSKMLAFGELSTYTIGEFHWYDSYHRLHFKETYNFDDPWYVPNRYIGYYDITQYFSPSCDIALEFNQTYQSPITGVKQESDGLIIGDGLIQQLISKWCKINQNMGYSTDYMKKQPTPLISMRCYAQYYNEHSNTWTNLSSVTQSDKILSLGDNFYKITTGVNLRFLARCAIAATAKYASNGNVLQFTDVTKTQLKNACNNVMIYNKAVSTADFPTVPKTNGGKLILTTYRIKD